MVDDDLAFVNKDVSTIESSTVTPADVSPLAAGGHTQGVQFEFIDLSTPALRAPKSTGTAATLIGQVQYLEPPEDPNVMWEVYQLSSFLGPVIEEVARKARSGRMLNHEEKLVVFFTLGFLNDSLKSLHSVLEPCPDYRPKKVDRLASRLKSNPISCPKIRELLPETTAYLLCNCSFPIPEGSYPSPLLHIDPKLVPSRAERLSSFRHEEILKEYNALNVRIKELLKRRGELKLILRNVQPEVYRS